MGRPLAAVPVGWKHTGRYNNIVRIREFIWPEDRVEHIAGHGVTPEEVEEACFGQALIQQAKSEGENPVFYILGQTEPGRYLFCMVIRFPGGVGYPVTARPMTDKEKRRYQQWQRK
jgi:hypothetical protein